MKNIFKTLYDFLKVNIIWMLVLLAYTLIAHFCHFSSCLVKLIFSVPCPFCGMTRAVVALITLHPVVAFHYNPFVYVLPFLAVIIIYKDYKYINKIYSSKIFWFSLLSVFIMVFIIRLIYIFPNAPLNIYKRGLLLKIIKYFKNVKNV